MKVYLVSKGEYDDYDVLAAFGVEAVANRAVSTGFGERVESLDVLDEVPERMTVWQVSASLSSGVHEPVDYQRWGNDLADLHLDLVNADIPVGATSWSVRSLDREKAVAAVTEALAARRAELGVPNA